MGGMGDVGPPPVSFKCINEDSSIDNEGSSTENDDSSPVKK